MQYSHNKHPALHILLDGNTKRLELPSNNIIELKHIINLYIFLKKWMKGEKQSNYLDLKLDFIGTFENLNEDLNKIFGKLNITNCELPHENKSRSKEFTLSNDAKKFCDLILKEDFELYNKLGL